MPPTNQQGSGTGPNPACYPGKELHMDFKKMAMFGGAVLLTLVVYRVVLKGILPASITGFIGI